MNPKNFQRQINCREATNVFYPILAVGTLGKANDHFASRMPILDKRYKPGPSETS